MTQYADTPVLDLYFFSRVDYSNISIVQMQTTYQNNRTPADCGEIT